MRARRCKRPGRDLARFHGLLEALQIFVQLLFEASPQKAGENRTSASFGGPLTQGTLTVAAATQAGVEKYVLKGYDKRTAMGAGKLQLVVSESEVGAPA